MQDILTNDEFDRQVTQKMLSMVKPNKFHIKHGVDLNTVKGINTFPIYNDPNGIKSDADPTLQGLYFSSVPQSAKYDIKEAKHSAVPMKQIRDELYPYDYYHKIPHKKGYNNPFYEHGLSSRMFGIPDKKLIIENYAAEKEGMVGISAKEFQVLQMQKEAPEEVPEEVPESPDNEAGGGSGETPRIARIREFMADGRVEAIVKGTPMKASEITVGAETPSTETPAKKKRNRRRKQGSPETAASPEVATPDATPKTPVVVRPAFEEEALPESTPLEITPPKSPGRRKKANKTPEMISEPKSPMDIGQKPVTVKKTKQPAKKTTPEGSVFHSPKQVEPEETRTVHVVSAQPQPRRGRPAKATEEIVEKVLEQTTPKGSGKAKAKI